MNADDLRAFLTQRQLDFEEKPIPHGIQFRCQTGEIVSVYRTGKVVVQGKDTPIAVAIREWSQTGRQPVAREPEPAEEPVRVIGEAPGPDRRVFIVYGHDTHARDNLELLLRRWGLEPIVLQNLPATGDTVIEKLERYLGQYGNIGFACVVLTPDDEGHKAGRPEEKRYRGRQNVVLELGMVLARLGRRRVAILIKESVEQPSDIAGLIYIPFQERVDEVQHRLYQELGAAGYRLRPPLV